jgi:hypothetical protein
MSLLDLTWWNEFEEQYWRTTPIPRVSAKHLPRYLREWSYRFNRRNLPECLDRYLIRRAVECATITYDQLKAGVIPAGATRVRRLPVMVGQGNLF